MNLLDSTYLQIFLGLLSALVLFLYAIENLSNELQGLASERFREIISKLARNKYIVTIVGAFSTAVIHSSSEIRMWITHNYLIIHINNTVTILAKLS